VRVLVGCEFSGVVREAFRKRGHEAWSCDLLDTEIKDGGGHIIGDVLEAIKTEKWDLLIAHPPCTYLTNSGVRWLHTEPGRWDKMEEGVRFFKALLTADIEKICIENPIPHGYAAALLGEKYTQIIQPWQFGHPEQKATCLWLKNLPPLKETNNVKEEMMRLSKKERQKVWMASPGKDRWKIRSRTYTGIAEGMAQAWG